MKRSRLPRLPALVAPTLFLGAGLLAQSPHRLELGDAVAEVGSVAAVPLTLDASSEVQGLVAIFEWNSAAIE
jgi:hypothetical protein